MANETFEVYSLTSKLGLDTTQFDRAYGDARKKVITLSDDFKRVERSAGSLGAKVNQTLRPSFSGLQSSITGLGGPLDGTISRVSTLTSLGGKLSLTTAGLGLGFGIVATGAIAAGAGMFAMAKSAAEAGDEIYDLTQKVNFSAESISTLKNEGELAGVEFQSISAGLGIFNKNVEAAQSGNKTLANTFKTLKINLSDNETALRSTFKALMAVEDGGQQTALAMQIFGKGGKDVLGIIKSMNGDIDAATEKFRGMNSLITTESAKAANEFSDKLRLLEQRFDGVTRSIGERFMPTATDALDKVSQALDDNSRHAATWADALVHAAEFAATQIKYILEGLAIVIEGFQKTFGEGSIVGDAIKGETQRKLLSLPNGNVMDLNTREEFDLNDPIQKRRFLGLPTSDDGEYAIAGGAGQYSVGAGPGGASKKTSRIDFGGGGGGKRGGAARDLLEEQRRQLEKELQYTLETMEGEESGVERSYAQRRLTIETYHRAVSRLEENRHNEVLKTLEEEKKLAEQIKDPAKRADALGDISIRKQQEANRHRREGYQLEDKVKQVTRERIALVGTLVERLTREREVMKQINQERSRFASEVFRDDLGGGSGVLTPGVRDATGRPRVATVDETVARERRQILRDQMMQVADDLTDMIDEAITAGFEGGLDDGVAAFGRAILRMAKHEALDALRKAIFNALNPGKEGDEQSAGGGGSWISTLIRTGVAAVAALFGGGSSGGLGSSLAGGIGGAAEGGYQPAGKWYWRGEQGPELVKAGPGGDSIMSNPDSLAFAGMMAGGGGQTINIYANDVRAAFSRETLTQAKSKLRKLQRGR